MSDAKPASKKRSAPSASKNNCTNELVALTKAITALNKSLEDQDKRTEALNEFLGDSLKDWQTKLEAARHAFEIEEEQREQKRQRQEVEHELDIKSHGRQIAMKMLEEEGFTAIRAEEEKMLREQVKVLQERLENVEASTREAVKADMDKDHLMAVDRLKLTNEAKVATLTERNKLQEVQMKSLNQTIIDLRADISSTQDMVKEFAGKPTVVKTVRD